MIRGAAGKQLFNAFARQSYQSYSHTHQASNSAARHLWSPLTQAQPHLFQRSSDTESQENASNNLTDAHACNASNSPSLSKDNSLFTSPHHFPFRYTTAWTPPPSTLPTVIAPPQKSGKSPRQSSDPSIVLPSTPTLLLPFTPFIPPTNVEVKAPISSQPQRLEGSSEREVVQYLTAECFPHNSMNSHTAQGKADMVVEKVVAMNGMDALGKRDMVFSILEGAGNWNGEEVNEIAQKIFAKMNDVEGLRQWKRRSTHMYENENSIPAAAEGTSEVAHVLEEAKDNDRKMYLESMSQELLRFSKSKKTASAINTFEKLTAKNLTPLGDATHAFFELLATDYKLHLAIRYFDLLNAIERMNTPSSKLSRHQYFLYNSILSACCIANKPKKALHFYEAMKADLHQLPDLKTITKLFTLLSKDHSSTSLSCMLSILSDLTNHNITPYPLLYNLTLSKCVAANKLNLAQSVFSQMKSSNIVPTAVTYSTLIKGYLSSHQLSQAELLFKEMTSHPVAATSSQFMNSIGPFNAMIQYYITQHRDIAAATQIFKIYETKFSKLVQPTGFTFHLLISGTSSLEHPDKGIEYIRYMTEKYGLEPNASHFTPVLEELVKRGETKKAKLVLSEVMKREFQVEIRGEAIERIVKKIEG
ncbi:hypothetical protein BKA69DRAFT_1048757 [Paraphysoderma sedebokerense]|nr:hypothetical protein BKA69DRAFT_1048757 [Paraphysoderma sedebokerense]